MTCGSQESHNSSGIHAKEQEELLVCWLRYLPFLLFVVEWSHVPAARKPVIMSQNKQIMLFLKREMGRLAHTPPVKWQLTVVYSRHASIHPCVSFADEMKGHVTSESPVV